MGIRQPREKRQEGSGLSIEEIFRDRSQVFVYHLPVSGAWGWGHSRLLVCGTGGGGLWALYRQGSGIREFYALDDLTQVGVCSGGTWDTIFRTLESQPRQPPEEQTPS